VQGFVQRPPEDAAKQWNWLHPRPARRISESRPHRYVTAPGKPEIANYLLVHLYRTPAHIAVRRTPQLSFSFLTATTISRCARKTA